MLGIIASEAAFGEDCFGSCRDYGHVARKLPVEPERPKTEETGPSLSYNLRVVREKDGTLKWEDR